MPSTRLAQSIVEDDRAQSTRSNHATRTALPSEVDPLSVTMRASRAMFADASGSRTRPRSEASDSRRGSFEETADTTPFELIDPVNPAATLRDMPLAAMKCRRRMQIALLASFVLAIAGYITVV